MVDGTIQNKVSAILVAIPGLLFVFSQAWGPITQQITPFMAMIPEEYRGLVLAIIAAIILFAIIWNYTSSVLYGEQMKQEGVKLAQVPVETTTDVEDEIEQP